MFLNAKIRWRDASGEGGNVLFSRALNRLAEGIRNWRPFLRGIARNVLELSVAERFNSEGDGEWGELAESTLRERAKEGFPPGPILERTGDLKDSFRTGGGGHIEEYTATSLTWGSGLRSKKGYPYAVVHQTGNRGGTLPARPILVMTQAMIDRITEAGKYFLATLGKSSGFTVNVGTLRGKGGEFGFSGMTELGTAPFGVEPPTFSGEQIPLFGT